MAGEGGGPAGDGPERRVIRRPFHLPAGGGELLRGTFLAPQGAPPREAVILVPGFGEFARWGFFPWLSGRLLSRGFAVVSFDFSRNGIGRDETRITELDAFARNTISREVSELETLVAALAGGEIHGRPPRRIALLGHGRGGGEVVLVAAKRPIDALVTWSAVSTFNRWRPETRKEWRDEGRVFVLERPSGRQLPVDVSLLEDVEGNAELDPLRAAAGHDAPWLLLHGTGDVRVPVREAKELARAGKRARLALLEEGDHSYGVTHPFEGPGPVLRRAARLTLDHLAASSREASAR